MRIADKVYTSLLQRQAQPRATGKEKPKQEAGPKLARSDAQPAQQDGGKPKNSGLPLSGDGVRTLDALIREQILDIARDKTGTASQADDKDRLDALAAQIDGLDDGERAKVMSELELRQQTLTKADEQNSKLIPDSLQTFLS